jgi:hypothetical protein
VWGAVKIEELRVFIILLIGENLPVWIVTLRLIRTGSQAFDFYYLKGILQYVTGAQKGSPLYYLGFN